MTTTLPDTGMWHGSPSLEAMLVEVGDLVPDPGNANVHDERNLATIAHSLRRYGQQKPIVVSAQGVIAAGNGTWQAARELGWTHIAAVVSQLSNAELVGYGLVDNRTSELSHWDEDVLAATLGGLDEDGVPLDELGWNADEIRSLLSDFPVDEHGDDEQPRLDELDPIECGHCGGTIDRRSGKPVDG